MGNKVYYLEDDAVKRLLILDRVTVKWGSHLYGLDKGKFVAITGEPSRSSIDMLAEVMDTTWEQKGKGKQRTHKVWSVTFRLVNTDDINDRFDQFKKVLDDAPFPSAWPEAFEREGDPAAWMEGYSKWFRDDRFAALFANFDEELAKKIKEGLGG